MKFGININNDELLETIRKHEKKIKYLIIIGSMQQCKEQIDRWERNQ
jgi:hypothetical protein